MTQHSHQNIWKRLQSNISFKLAQCIYYDSGVVVAPESQTRSFLTFGVSLFLSNFLKLINITM